VLDGGIDDDAVGHRGRLSLEPGRDKGGAWIKMKMSGGHRLQAAGYR
jgi:hypothetical protein